MSEIKCYYATGVFKLDYKKSSYKELLEVVNDWKNDENFYLLMLRKVSEENRGIQFIYLESNNSEKVDWVIKSKYKHQLKEKFGSWLYAWDYQEWNRFDKETIIVFKELKI